MTDFDAEPIEQEGLPPDQVRVLKVQAESWSNGTRIRVLIEITPFQIRPDIEAAILDLSGNQVSRINIVECIDQKLVFTMHLRVPQPENQYHLCVKIMYRDLGLIDEKRIDFDL